MQQDLISLSDHPYTSDQWLVPFKMLSELIQQLGNEICPILDAICHTGYCRGIAFEIMTKLYPETICLLAIYMKVRKSRTQTEIGKLNWMHPQQQMVLAHWEAFCANLNFVLYVTVIDDAVTLGAVEESKRAK